MEDKNYKKIGIYDNCFNSYIYNQIEKNFVCLDIGCWTGNLGKRLINNKKCIVDGIDYKDEVLVAAKKNGYRNVYKINFNNEYFDLDVIKNKYDYIICADVLEHLINPLEVLKKIKEYLKEDGLIIISVPNIAFIQQRFFLLFGKFDYNPNGGIMDQTHLRFFTKRSIEKLCKDAGYTIVKSYGYSLVKNKFFFLRPLAKIWPELFALQFLIICD